MTPPSTSSFPKPLLRRRNWTEQWQWPAVALLLLLYVILALQGVRGRSVTADEPFHLAGGLSYWQFGDYRLQPENGNLPQRWGALPLYIAGLRHDPSADESTWRYSAVAIIAHRLLFKPGLDSDKLLWRARCTMLSFGLLAGMVVYLWSRCLWGLNAGLCSLALFAVSPITLAHGPLVTSDMCAAGLLLAATWALWQACVRPAWTTAMVAGIAFGLALVAKFSAVLLLPLAGGFFACALAAGYRSKAPGAAPRRKAAPLIGTVALAAVVSWAVIWTFYSWRHGFTGKGPGLPPIERLNPPWEKLSERGLVSISMLRQVKEWHILPHPWIYGLAHVFYYSSARSAFLAGLYSNTGWWWFFPFAFLVKSTLGELVLSLLTLIKSGSRLARAAWPDWANAWLSPLFPLILFAVIYGIASITSNLNIGQRHLLPLYLVLFIAAGGLFTLSRPRWLRVISFAALLGSGVEVAFNHPNSLAFFNRAAGGPANGWRLLVDSSLDWGQDVAPLVRWLEPNRHSGERVYLSLFGTADPFHDGAPQQNTTLLTPYFSVDRPYSWQKLEPGLYCVSVTILQNVYGPKTGAWSVRLEHDYQSLRAKVAAGLANGSLSPDLSEPGFHPENSVWLLDRLRFIRLCQYLLVRAPDAVINHAIFVYRLDAREVRIVEDRPFSELTSLMDQADPASKLKADSRPTP